MKLTIHPGNPLRGETTLPGDKSISHRAALFAALADGMSRIEHFLTAGTTMPLLNGLTSLRVAWELEDETLTVFGNGLQGFSPSDKPFDCGHSATCMRLLAGAISAAGVPGILDGSLSLRNRPMDRIIQPLRLMGVSIDAQEDKYAPLRIAKRDKNIRLSGIKYNLPVASAQVKTCLLLAGLGADSPVILTEPHQSRDHSERLLSLMGVSVQTQDHSPSIGHIPPEETLQSPRILPDASPTTVNQNPPEEIFEPSHILPDASPTTVNQNPPEEIFEPSHILPDASPTTVKLIPTEKALKPLTLQVPGDFSSAAFLIAAALITPGSDILLRDVGLNPTRIGFLDVLLEMGARIEIQNRRMSAPEPVGDLHIQFSQLNPVEIHGSKVVRMIDEFPVFALVAAAASGKSIVSDAMELRFKESDRIRALCAEMAGIGIHIQELRDGFTVDGPQSIRGGLFNPRNDHRLAMTAAIAGINASAELTIDSAEIIQESFPGFTDTLKRLGVNVSLHD